MRNLPLNIPEKILVVDDIEVNRKLLRQTLAAINDYTILEAADGKQAVEIFEKEKPDLVLMDIDMPEMDGCQSAAEIKNISCDIYTPIIFITAMSTESALAMALSSGGDDFISKPFRTETLMSKIAAHFRIRELNQKLNYRNEQLLRLNNYLAHEQELIEHFFENALQQSYLDNKYINYHMSAMSTFNGDVFLVARGPCGGLYLVLGDFTGHGLSASIGTLPVAQVFFKMAAAGSSINDIVTELNLQLNNLLPTGMFFAATLIELKPDGDVMSVWMGGMPESYWLGNDGRLKGEIHSRHMPLGILDESEFDSTTEVFSVQKGDKIYLYSDGVIETCGVDGEMFGQERLKNALVMHDRDRMDQVLNEMKVFSGACEQTDDVTLVEMTCDCIPAVGGHEKL